MFKSAEQAQASSVLIQSRACKTWHHANVLLKEHNYKSHKEHKNSSIHSTLGHFSSGVAPYSVGGKAQKQWVCLCLSCVPSGPLKQVKNLGIIIDVDLNFYPQSSSRKV